jgi:hypothetical protein
MKKLANRGWANEIFYDYVGSLAEEPYTAR